MNRLMRDLRYEEVVSRGLKALREASAKEGPQLSAVYKLLGTAYFLLGDETHARGAWVQLFALDTEARPPEDASPKLRQFFERVRIEAAAVSLDPAPIKEIPEGQPLEMEARLGGPAPHVDKVFVHYRTEGAGAYTIKRLDRSGSRLHAVLPGVVLADAAPRAFEYFLEARDSSGAPIASAGTEAAPLRAKVIPKREPIAAADPGPHTPPPVETPVYKRWWFWSIIGAAAAGAGAAIYFGTSGGSGTPPPMPGLDVCVGFQNAPCPPR